MFLLRSAGPRARTHVHTIPKELPDEVTLYRKVTFGGQGEQSRLGRFSQIVKEIGFVQFVPPIGIKAKDRTVRQG